MQNLQQTPSQIQEKKYYVIKDVDGGPCQIIRHGFASAEKEIERLCRKHVGRRFMLFRAVGIMIVDNKGKMKKIKAQFVKVPTEKKQYQKLKIEKKKAIKKQVVKKAG